MISNIKNKYCKCTFAPLFSLGFSFDLIVLSGMMKNLGTPFRWGWIEGSAALNKTSKYLLSISPEKDTYWYGRENNRGFYGGTFVFAFVLHSFDLIWRISNKCLGQRRYFWHFLTKSAPLVYPYIKSQFKDSHLS